MDDDTRTQRERMLAGDPHLASDPELLAASRRAIALCEEYTPSSAPARSSPAICPRTSSPSAIRRASFERSDRYRAGGEAPFTPPDDFCDIARKMRGATVELMRASLGVTLSSLLLYGCASEPAPVMAPRAPQPSVSPSLVEVARAEPAPGQRALLVAYPKTACSGSARTVFMDEKGTFFGALAPGQATLLTFPAATRTLVAVSSVEISAPTRTTFTFVEIDVPAAPAALLLEGARVNARQCSRTGQYAHTSVVTKRAIEERLAEEEIAWLEPRPLQGQAWLDKHRSRVNEILAKR
jgi:hypothetical protein